MKKPTFYFVNFLGLLMVFNSFQAKGQSSDEIKYDIAYDVSGSVPFFDRNNNLKTLLGQLVKAKFSEAGDGRVKSYASFNVYFFGQDSVKVTGRGAFNAYANNPKKESDTIIRQINKYIGASHSQRKTYLHVALNEIWGEQYGILKKGPDPTSKGIFIFTDGSLRDGDFNKELYKDRVTYANYIKTLIGKLETVYKIPVFIIQCSTTPADPYLITSDGKSLAVADSARYLAKDNYFWVRTSISLDSVQNRQILNAFASFVDQANTTIASAGDNPVIASDPVSAVLGFQQVLFTLRSLGGKDTTEVYAKFKVAIGAVGDQTDTVKSSFTTAMNSLWGELSEKSPGSASIKMMQGNLQTIARHPDLFAQFSRSLSLSTNPVPSPSGGAANPATPTAETSQSLSLAEAGPVANPTDLTNAVSQSSNASLQTQLWEGLAKIIVDRAEKSVLYSLCTNINQLLGQNSKANDLTNALMPHVRQLISNPDRYTNLAAIRDAFFEDFNNLPDNLVAHPEYIHSEGMLTLVYYYQLAQNIVATGRLEDAFQKLQATLTREKVQQVVFTEITSMPNDPATKDLQTGASVMHNGILFTARLIGYLTSHNLTSIFKNDGTFQDAAKMLTELSIDPATISNINDLDQAAAQVQVVYNKYVAVKAQIAALQQSLKTPQPNQNYQDFVEQQEVKVLQSAASLMLSGTAVLKQLHVKGADINAQQLEMITSRANDCIKAYFEIRSGQYAEAGSLLLPDLVSSLRVKFPQKDSVTFYLMQKALTIAAQISSAKTKQDAMEVIEENALPATSFTFKREGYHLLSLTAYPGVGGLYYFNKNVVDPGIVCPVGFEWTLPLKPHSDLSIFVPVVDIGNIVNYQVFNNGGTANAVNFSNIASPGLLLSLGIGSSTPIALICGYEANPSRIVASVTIDVPLFSFWRSGKH